MWSLWGLFARVPNGWKRLGRTIVAERARRKWDRGDLADATGLSVRLLDDIENGRRRRYKDYTLAVMEAALGWEPGSCEQVVRGGRPTPVPDLVLARVQAAWPHLSDDARLMLAELAERSVLDR